MMIKSRLLIVSVMKETKNAYIILVEKLTAKREREIYNRQ
jgi:hypothetical protein